MVQRGLVWTLAVVLIATAAWIALSRSVEQSRLAGFDLWAASQRGCAIVIPGNALPQEREAAELLRSTFARASGIPVGQFPILREAGPMPPRAFFVGATRRSHGFLDQPRRAPFDTAVGLRVRLDEACLRAERREAIVGAAGWFLESRLGAHWFMPGPLGEYVPRRGELVLVKGEQVARPAFLSRDIGTAGSGEERAWYARNRLENRFDHGHNLLNIFQPEDFRRQPEMAPLRNGAPYLPPAKSYGWQPNFLSRAAVEHAAKVANRALAADPLRATFSLSINDSIRFDESAATVAAVAPPRYFRHRPDYSNLVFRFVNEVASVVAPRHPDRYLPAYAYYWCENTPDFRVAPNVVPFLTADRAQWSHPDFAAEDRDLIARWRRSGAKIVGLYDYYEGAPFTCPRPTLYAVRQAIPFAFEAGVRAFFAEGSPNWGLDGPKQWLASQLLWSPQRDPGELLETYFREFWAESAAPMREFFSECERTWLNQPGPALWLRFYDDEDHTLIYSPADLAALRGSVSEAARAARTPVVAARVAFVAAALAVTERFADFCAARRELSRLARPGLAPAELLAGWTRYRDARARFVETFNDVRRERPLAIAPPLDLRMFLRNQPDSRIARELTRTEAGRAFLRASSALSWSYVGLTPEEITAVLTSGTEGLQDAGWQQLATRPVGSSTAYDWTEPNQSWRGTGEPWEGRKVELQREGVRRVLRIAGARVDNLGQWAMATPNALYAAQVKVRAKVSPGTATFLVLSFLDENQRHIGAGLVDRVPAGDETQTLELCVLSRAPANARYVGVGLHVLEQINDDFAEFSEVSLRVKADR